MSERLDYMRQLEAQITTSKAALAQLKAERQVVLEAVQHEEIENLEKYLGEADVSLKGIADAGDDAWSQLKDDLDKLVKSISDALTHLLGEDDNQT